MGDNDTSLRMFKFRDVIPELPNIILRRRFKFNFELLPYEIRELRLKQILNFFLAGINQFSLPSRPIGYPVFAQVEPANFCNLSCPLCLTTSVNQSRQKAILQFDIFKKLIDEIGEYLLLIVLWNWGEPFLNPDIFKMIAYAKSKNIIVHSSTNGNVKFDKKNSEKLVDSGLDSLVFAVDGATQATYSLYRKGGNLNHVKANIKRIISARNKKGSETPRLNLRFVVMKNNEKELPFVKQLAKELEVDYFTVKTVDMPPVIGENLDNSYAPESSKYQRYEYETGSYHRKQKIFSCVRPWKRITLDASGEIIPCEYDYKNFHSFGNINSDKSHVAIWKGMEAKNFRRKFNKGWNNGYYLCKDCTYKNRAADDCTIERFDLNL